MASRTPFTVNVTYGEHVAKFSSRAHAIEFARHISGAGGHFVEVTAPDGVIAQFDPHGNPLPEFQEQHAPRVVKSLLVMFWAEVNEALAELGEEDEASLGQVRDALKALGPERAREAAAVIAATRKDEAA